MERSTPATRAFWSEFIATRPAPVKLVAIDTFGDSPRLITELVALVVEGRKRATAGLVRDTASQGLPNPAPGDHWIVVDAQGDPVCINETTHTRVGPVSSVDDDFAWDEGEGDRTREDWLRGHRAYYRRQAEREGWTYTDDELCVFERFAVVWPPALADRPAPAAIDPSQRFVHLGPANRAAEVPVDEKFWATISTRADLGTGRLLSVGNSETSWTHWERHPAGEEWVMLLSGRADLVFELEDREHVVELQPQQGVLVPAGVWHRAVVHSPARLLAITPGQGTEHRPMS
ncbi:MAG: ASCH domain-containing protein [Deltaproteobacteria bacterium]|nr:ASCH domain-containing protein [Deltaproteobacteria bacterium]